MILGMDFGTTNSGMAIYDGRDLRLIPLDPAGASGVIDRTALYVTHEHSIVTGRRAIDRYLEQNVGRPARMERVRVGTIAVTAAEIGTYYRDVHIERDVLAPGRLFTSFKTFLASTSYEGTIVGGLSYTLEDIVSAYLRVAKLRAERFLEREIRAIVLGRPVAFSRDHAADTLARDRLVRAALRAGYDTVYLQHEPVAAAFHFETSLRRERIVLVFDFGGGTLDVTIMRIGNPKTRAVLAAAGIPVAGDVFDQRIVRLKLARLFGEGSTYGPPTRRMPVPAWIYDALADWQSIVTLQQPENRTILEEILASSDQPQRIRNLIALAARNYGLKLYTAVEEAKRALSDEIEATIQLEGSDLALREPIARHQFEALIREDTRAVERLLADVVREAGLCARDIDAVVRTGGSSRIPIFVALLQRTFGAEKVRSIDVFSSVASGLAVAAQRIEAGELEAEPYGRDGRPEGAVATTRAAADVPAVDPGFLMAWVTAQEHASVAPNPCAAVTWLATDYRLRTRELPRCATGEMALMSLDGVPAGDVMATQAILSGLDDRLVLVTSAYRFLLTTPRQLLVLDHSGVGLPQLHGFDRGEVICALGLWDAVRAHPQLAVVTGRGVVRLIDMERVRSRLDRSIPFSLEKTTESDPIALVGVGREQQLAIVTTKGRAVRLRLNAVSFRGIQALKRNKDERIVGCVPVREPDQLLLVTDNGVARLIPAALVPLAVEPNIRGRTVAARAVVRGAARHDPVAQLWLLTSRYLRPVGPDHLRAAMAAPARKPFGLAALDVGEQVVALVTRPR